MHVWCFDEGTLQVRRVGFVARNDTAASLSFDLALFALFALSSTPRNSGTPVLWPRFSSKLQAAVLPAKRKSNIGKPRAGVPRRQAMDEAIHFPRLASVSASFQHRFEPRVVRPQRFRQKEGLLHAVFAFVPEHFVRTLLQEIVSFLVGISKDSTAFDWRQLPQVATDPDVDASETPLLAEALRVPLRGASSAKIHVQDSEEVRRERAAFVDEDPTQTLHFCE